MKEVDIVGLGVGVLTAEGREAIAKAGALIGAPRMLDTLPAEYTDGKRLYRGYLPKDVNAVIAEDNAERIAVLVSGDTGFYSAASVLSEKLENCRIRFIPGISCVQAFFARLKLPWQDARFISAHGRAANIADAVRRNRYTFVLTGNNVPEIGASLVSAGLPDIICHVGENLGTDAERVYEMRSEELSGKDFPSLTVLLFVNEHCDRRTPVGINDGNFIRNNTIPMTKSEVRAVAMSKMNIKPGDICWDIGAGSGSVTVEMALSAYEGKVYAVEHKPEAAWLTRENCRKFHIGNVEVVQGEAPSALSGLPAPNIVIIGGSGGKLPEIIREVLNRNERAAILVTAVTVETVGAAVAALESAGRDTDISQITAARGRRVGNSHMLEGMNPVTIIYSDGGR